MIKANIAFSDLADEVRLRDGNLHFGNSSISPYRHRALETLVLRTQGHWFATIRERAANRPASPPCQLETVDAGHFQQAYREALLWPLDYLVVEVAQAGCRLKLRAGMQGAAPVYCRTTESGMTVSYDLADFFAGPCLLDPAVISRRLGLHTDYSARQICAGVLMLTERSVLFAQPGEARYHYPSATEPAPPSQESLPDGGMSSFRDRLSQAMGARPLVRERVAVELSGGMDSAAVACALGSQLGKVASLGVQLGGDGGSQAGRRAAVVHAFGLDDHTVDMACFPPSLDLRPNTARAEYPFDDFYLGAFESLWDTARSQGCDMLFTGLGGDQLFPVHVGEPLAPNPRGSAIVDEASRRAYGLLTPAAREAARALSGLDAPPGPLQASVLASHACQSPHLLKRGLWPVSPLGDPYLAAYCQGLPLACRSGRETLRRYLQAALGSDVFPAGYLKETFAHVLPPLIGAQAARIAGQLKECALADMGLVNRDAALRLLDDLVRTGARALTAPLASLLWMERFVRQF